MRGKPREQGWLGGCREEHPRVCGENGSLFPWLPTPLENIPAYAGKTRPPISPWLAWSEHPRVCGENSSASGRYAATSGTSPRMRGKQTHLGDHYDPRRNIPAYAGKTPRHLRPGHYHEEHPRVCGENKLESEDLAKQLGTSPRMRGKLSRIYFTNFNLRNIPAYAGKTATSGTVSMPATEHPRACGENRAVGELRGTA